MRKRLKGGDRQWIVLQDRYDQTGLALSLASFASGRHLVDLASGIGFFAFELFWRHVLKRPQNGSGSGEARILCRQGRKSSHGPFSLVRFRQTKIEKLGACFREHDVAGFEVAMDHTVAVRVVEGIANLNGVAAG